MTLHDELSKSKEQRKAIVRGYMSELLDSHVIIEGYEAVYGNDATKFPKAVHSEVMALVARATEIHTHIPTLRKSCEVDNSFSEVDNEISIMLGDQ